MNLNSSKHSLGKGIFQNLDIWIQKAYRDEDKFIWYALPFLADSDGNIEDEARDIFREAIFTAIDNVRNKKIAAFNNYEGFYAYSFKIAQNLLRSYNRRKKIRVTLNPNIDTFFSEEKTDINPQKFSITFWDAMNQLKPQEKQLLELTIVGGHSNAEAAFILEIREEDVRKRKSRYKKKLAEIIKKRKSEYLS